LLKAESWFPPCRGSPTDMTPLDPPAPRQEPLRPRAHIKLLAEQLWMNPGLGKGSAEPLAGVLGHTGLQLLAQFAVVEVAADQDQLVFALPVPVRVIDREAFAGQVKHMAPLTFVEPEDPFGTEHAAGQLVIEEVLELA